MQQSIVKFYCFVVLTLLNMFRELQCPSLGGRQTAVAALGFRVNVEGGSVIIRRRFVSGRLYDKAIKFYD